MIKKTVNYTNFDGNATTEDCYFNLMKTELTEMAMELPDGISEIVGDDPSKVDSEAAALKMFEMLGNKGIYDFLKTLVLKSYGIKSADGRRFEKSEQLRNEFSQSLAFDTIMSELTMGDGTAAADFINAIIPAEIITGGKPALVQK